MIGKLFIVGFIAFILLGFHFAPEQTGKLVVGGTKALFSFAKTITIKGRPVAQEVSKGIKRDFLNETDEVYTPEP